MDVGENESSLDMSKMPKVPKVQFLMDQERFAEAWRFAQLANYKTVNEVAHEFVKIASRTDPRDLHIFFGALGMIQEPPRLRKMANMFNLLAEAKENSS